MLTILNNYQNGYVAIPVILACLKRGLFKQLNQSNATAFTDLVQSVNANPGYLRIALQMLESMNWLSRIDDNYRLTNRADAIQWIPEETETLMNFPFNTYLEEEQKEYRLDQWIQLSAQQWNSEDKTIATFLDGLLIIPLVIALKKMGLFNDLKQDRKNPFSSLPTVAKDEVTTFFINQQWLINQDGLFQLTDVGRFITDRIFNTAIVGSYRPMLNQIETVLFGDSLSVFQYDSEGHELHVDRTLNVIGSGFQHEKYFANMEELILSMFDKKPWAEQPKYIADMGCGDGTLLKKIYEIIKFKSGRGKVLQQYPIKLIGVDYNEKSLLETTRTLQGIDHMVLKGDIGDPKQMVVDLKAQGVEDVENILHVRSFLDHDRPYIAPTDKKAEKARANIPCESVCAERSGKELPKTAVIQSLVEHFARWSSIMGKHGLVLLEVHCLDPKTTEQFLEKSEAFHFDTYHRFSQQLLVDANSFVMSAAEAGLFPNPRFFRKYPKTMPFSRITLNYFERRDYKIRYATKKDLPVLEQLEKKCWRPELRTPPAQLKKRVKNYPEGQLVLEMEGRGVVGVVYSQRIADAEALKNSSVETVENLHNRSGSIIQLLTINILPEIQNRNLGDQLLEFMLQRCALTNSVQKVVGVTRCKDYHKHDNLHHDEYIDLRTPQGKRIDTTLRFHEMHGAQIKQPIAGYRPKDQKNRSYGVLIEYNLRNRKRKEIQAVSEEVTTKRLETVLEFVKKTIALILGLDNEDAFSMDHPLMEIGLDSADLLELNEQISCECQLTLDPDFFFKYSTGNRVASYLSEQAETEIPLEKEEIKTNEKISPLIREFIVKTIALILGLDDSAAVSTDRPLMEMGLDSADLLELNEQISCEYQLTLDPDFFFKYSTIARIIDYLTENSDIQIDEALETEETEETEEFNREKPMPEASKTAPIDQDEIAIIGISCRLPGGITNPDQLWELLIAGKDAIKKLPEPRWEWPNDIDPDGEHQSIDRAGFLKEIDRFDASFFRVSPKEAELMDPQQRILLELSYHCQENAGYSPKEFFGTKTGVFIGASGSDYNRYLDKHQQTVEAHYGVGTAMAILPNRLSYFHNFHGPSIQVDTACSSSLVALHNAVGSIRAGECDQALVGAINIICFPTNSVAYYKAGMLAKDGKCKTFDHRANGYVRGEGAVMVLLKPLKQAINDQDNLLAIVKGTAINHGGQASGLTVPNPEKQAELVMDAIKSANIAPETISYIEAHGTGTSLGDPIEVSGLKEAFATLATKTDKTPWCGLGSIKTNIGHLEAAAGIAGLLKVILSMKHQTIPASLNYKQLNPHIKLQNTPFRVIHDKTPWQLPEQTQLRRAGISSFGSGGTNSHVILEEPPKQEQKTNENRPCYLICLSAKTEESLRQRKEELAEWLRGKEESTTPADISATLLLGRDHFEFRAAFTIQNNRELLDQLTKPKEENNRDSYFEGLAKPLDSLYSELGDKIIQELRKTKETNPTEYKKKATALADLYVKGYDPDWKALFGNKNRSRLSMPCYPFTRERYWFTTDESSVSQTTAATIHPLLHQNRSGLSGLSFTSTFTGKESFLTDHVIGGRKILPGVATPELIREAITQILGENEKKNTKIVLRDIVWLRPVVCETAETSLTVRLLPKNRKEIDWEITGKADETTGEPEVHSQGQATIEAKERAAQIDLATLRTECDRKEIEAPELYNSWQTLGFDYGPAHRAVQKLHLGDNQLLAKLELPEALIKATEPLQLHPSLLDAALQAVLGFAIDRKEKGSPALPFSLESAEIFAPCPPSMWARIESQPGTEERETQKMNIDLSDNQGKVCLRMSGFLSRPLKTDQFKTLMFHPYWKEKALSADRTAPSYARQIVLLCEMNETIKENLQARLSNAECQRIRSEENNVEQRFQDETIQLIHKIQTILKNKEEGNLLLQVVTPSQPEQQFLSALAAVLKTARLENPKLFTQLITPDQLPQNPEKAAEQLSELIQTNSLAPEDQVIRYNQNRRSISTWRELQYTTEPHNVFREEHGIYLITGGMGGLGLLFAKEIAQQTKNPTLILTGRSPLNREKENQLTSLRATGATAEYRQVDVTQKEQVAQLIQSIQKSYGDLHGILHTAGVIKDRYLIKKQEQEIREVLAPKVEGLINLDLATREQNLDLFLLFSSISGSVGNAGQVDYAAANAFMDQYALYRNQLVAANLCKGRTLSINWPLWKRGGMSVDKTTEQIMRETMGMVPMESENGIAAFYGAWNQKEDRVMVIEGIPNQIENYLNRETPLTDQPAPEKLEKGTNTKNTTDKEQAETFVKEILKKTIKLDPAKAKVDEPFDKFGIDSILQMNLIRELEKTIGELPKTLLFEYNSIGELSDYLSRNHAEVLREARSSQSEQRKPKSEQLKPEESWFTGIPENDRLQTATEAPVTSQDRGIAIIGISGRYPMAENAKEFWELLKNGKNAITEVEDWQWSASLTRKLATSQTSQFDGSLFGGFLNTTDRFDHQLFEIDQEAVRGLSPELRLFLETTWETFENAGYTRSALKAFQERTQQGVGLFVGTMYSQYSWSMDTTEEAGRVSNWTDWEIANRTSHFFDLTGPSIAVNSACSSSLTAIHLACESLLQNSCAMAIAGGINLTMDPSKYDALRQAAFLGSGNKSRSFGIGDGYIPGEGVGAVLLKPLSDAIQDNDRIAAVIKGSFVNHSGGRQTYTAPDPKQQAKLIADSLKRANIHPETIGYVESAANGSELGDPIEVIALNKAFSEQSEKKQFCSLGSVKSNIGHLEAASGISQLAKVLLQFQHKTLVPSINGTPGNANIKLERTAFYLQEKQEPWYPEKDQQTGKALPLRSMINSFGAGGAYANLIVETFDQKEKTTIPATPGMEKLILFSAQTEWSLNQYLNQVIDFLTTSLSVTIEEVAQASWKMNHDLKHRLAIPVLTIEELLEKLTRFQAGESDHIISGVYGTSLPIKGAAQETENQSLSELVNEKQWHEVAKQWIADETVELWGLYGNEQALSITLPKYAFDHNTAFHVGRAPSVGQKEKSTTFSKTFTYDENLLKDHKIFDDQILMGFTHCSLALQALTRNGQKGEITLSQVLFSDAIRVAPDETVEVNLELKQENGTTRFENRYFKSATGASVLTASGRITVEEEVDDIDATKAIRETIDQAIETMPGDRFYKHPEQKIYGDSLFTVREVHLLKESVFSEIELTEPMKKEAKDYVCHPAIFDAIHVTSTFAVNATEPALHHWVPFVIKNLRVRALKQEISKEKLYCHVRETKSTPEIKEFLCELYNATGTLLIRIDGFTTKRIPSKEALLGLPTKRVTPPETSTEKPQAIPEPIAVMESGSLQEKIRDYIRKKMAGMLGKSPQEIATNKNYMDMGVDSQTMTKASQAMEKEIGIELLPTLFFEYQNIDELSEYFADENAKEFTNHLGTTTPTATVQNTTAQTAPPSIRKAETKGNTKTATTTTINSQQDIAVIGMDGRWAGASDTTDFWKNLRESRDMIQTVPENRWNYQPWYDEDREADNKTYSKWGSFIDNVDRFDPLFFGISPRQATWMDPQVRILLEVIYGTIEDAGYAGRMGNTRTGVYAGVCFHEYWDEIVRKKVPITSYEYTSSIMSSLAAQISYIFDLQGPSIPLDNACASSLTALHLGCQALKTGECDQVFVAGMNLLLSPLHYVYFCRIQALSPTGRCHTFDQQADGYVPGEGVTAVLLKPLTRAIEDQDNIHAVIKGTAVNHVGRSNNPTSPRPELQTKLVLDAWENANISPETLSYIECHGTGTPLGDPIEINALKKAFKQYTNKEGFCVIGSAKAHIGHLEGAAGLTGVIKVILSMKNRILPKMPNFRELNPMLRLQGSPFRINRETTEWTASDNHPRRAGVSSFGMTGNNAHAVIEEYIHEQQEPIGLTTPAGTPVLIPISAKSEEQLRQQTKRLLTFIDNSAFSESDLPNIAYTLQTGREEMEKRLALMVQTVNELREKLTAFLNGSEHSDGLYQGESDGSKRLLTLLTADEDMHRTIDAWIEKGKYAKLLDLWVNGLTIDWKGLYGDHLPRRISLPTYPFAKERYWMPEINIDEIPNREAATTTADHPLLHRNISDFETVRFRSTFTGDEFFLTDHVVKGEKLLPGVTYLEMVRQAVAQAAGPEWDNRDIQLNNTVWVRPVTVSDSPVTIYVELTPEEDERITYTVYSEPEQSEEDSIIHSQGFATLEESEQSEPWDPEQLQIECEEKIFAGEQLYQAFVAGGATYGPALKGVEQVRMGNDKVLAKLKMPNVFSVDQETFFLHPALMDSALQVSLGLITGFGQDNTSNSMTPLKLALPFAVESVVIHNDTNAVSWALLRYSEDNSMEGTVRKLDIDLFDQQGEIAVEMKGFSTRVLEGDLASKPVIQETSDLLVPVWDRVSTISDRLSPESKERVTVIGASVQQWSQLRQNYPLATRLEFLPGTTVEEIMEKLRDHAPIDHLLWIVPDSISDTLTDDSLIDEQLQGSIFCFRLIKALLQLDHGTKALAWTVVTTQTQSIRNSENIRPAHASVHGLIGSMAKEYPNWSIRLVDMERDQPWAPETLFTLPYDRQGNAWGHRQGQWYRQQLIPFHGSNPEQPLYRDNGVYLVIGGAGGIGEVWSEYMIRTAQAQIIWIGRRPEDKTIRSKQEQLAQLGPKPRYFSADATDKESLAQALAEIKKEFPTIHGVVHSAIALHDQSLMKMEEETFRAGLKPKVDLSVRLAQLFEKEALDFMLFFSSIMNYTKYAGQSNYAAGCVFKDAFANQLARQWNCPVKIINWGYWGSIGVVASDSYRQRMKQIGFESIEPPEAMEAMEKLLNSSVDCVAMVKTNKPQALEAIQPNEALTSYEERFTMNIQDMKNRIEQPPLPTNKREVNQPGKVQSTLVRIAADLLGVDRVNIDPETEFNEYGFDPHSLGEFASRLSEQFTAKLNTLTLHEYPTIQLLTDYLAEEPIPYTGE